MPSKDELRKLAAEIDSVLKENEQVAHERDGLQTRLEMETVARAKAELRAEKLKKALGEVEVALDEAIEAEGIDDMLAEDILSAESEERYEQALADWEGEGPEPGADHIHDAGCGCAEVKRDEETAATMTALQSVSGEGEMPSPELRSIRRAILLDSARSFVAGSRSAVLRTCALATGVPAVLYTVFDQLARRGTYVEPLRSWWQPWVPTAYIYLVVLAVTFTVAFVAIRYGRSIVTAGLKALRKARPRPLVEDGSEPVTDPHSLPALPVEGSEEIRETRLGRIKSVLPRKKEREEPEEMDEEALAQLVKLFQTDEGEKPKLAEK